MWLKLSGAWQPGLYKCFLLCTADYGGFKNHRSLSSGISPISPIFILNATDLNPQQKNFRIQQWVIAVALVLFLIKIIAFFITNSVAILTDALESTVNVIAGFIGLYSLYIARKPKDTDHPYGHGKAEFLSAAVEGTLIIIAGFIIIYEAINNFIHPHTLQKLDWGILLISITAVLNYLVGRISLRNGYKNNSLALIASGKHLQSDAYSTLGLIIGLVLIYFTRIVWMDRIYIKLLFTAFRRNRFIFYKYPFCFITKANL